MACAKLTGGAPAEKGGRLPYLGGEPFPPEQKGGVSCLIWEGSLSRLISDLPQVELLSLPPLASPRSIAWRLPLLLLWCLRGATGRGGIRLDPQLSLDLRQERFKQSAL